MAKPRIAFEVTGPNGSQRFTLAAQSQTAKILGMLIDRGKAGVTALEVSSWALRMKW